MHEPCREAVDRSRVFVRVECAKNNDNVVTRGHLHTVQYERESMKRHFVDPTLTLTPFFSSSLTPAMVVPAGEVTMSFSCPGCFPVSSTIFAAPSS